jgi:hypothetical protein
MLPLPADRGEEVSLHPTGLGKGGRRFCPSRVAQVGGVERRTARHPSPSKLREASLSLLSARPSADDDTRQP